MARAEDLDSANPAELSGNHNRRAKAAAWFISILAPAMAGEMIAPQIADAKTQAGVELSSSNEQNGQAPESIILTTMDELAKLDRKVQTLYAHHNPHIKKYPYVERALDGSEYMRDYYVVKLPAGFRNGKRIYDKFVAAIARNKKKPNEYRLALGTAEYRTSDPTFDLYPQASEVMKLVYTEVPPVELALNITEGATPGKPSSPPQNIYSINRFTGGKLSILEDAKLTPKPVSVSTVAGKIKYFEQKAAQITAEA